LTNNGIQLILIITLISIIIGIYYLYYQPKYKKRLISDPNAQKERDAVFAV
jgi:hypothetical protein